MTDRSRYGYEDLGPFGRQLADHATKASFTFQPWDTAGMRESGVVARVRSALETHGHWSDYAEIAMDAGMVARIDMVTVNDGVAFRVSGGRGVTISATYRTLERALDMAAVFAWLGWEMSVATSWKDADLLF